MPRALDRPIADEAELVGPPIFQAQKAMYTEVLPGKGLEGGTLFGTNIVTETWYHEADGTTSELQQSLHDFYAGKPDFHEQPTERWLEINRSAQACPSQVLEHGKLMPCPFKARVIPSVDEQAMTALGFKPVDFQKRVRQVMLAHMKWYHPQTFNSLLNDGQITELEAKGL